MLVWVWVPLPMPLRPADQDAFASLLATHFPFLFLFETPLRGLPCPTPPMSLTMQITTTFTPSDPATDSLTLSDIRSAPGVYGSGSSDPAFLSLFGLVFHRDPVSGSLGAPLTDGDPRLFRFLPGSFTLSFTP